MFVFKASSYLDELKKYNPKIYDCVKEAYEKAVVDTDFIRLDKEFFSASPSRSIDYAVMENTSLGQVVPLDAGWNDVDLLNGKPTTERAVSLPEALKVVGSIPEFWIDFKYFTPLFAEKVLAAFEAVGISEDRLMVATYSQPALRYMKERHPSIRRIGHMDFMLVNGRWSPSFARAKGVTYAAAGKGEPMSREVVDGISDYASKMDLWGVNIGQNPKLVTKELVAALKAKGSLRLQLLLTRNTLGLPLQ